MSPLVLKAKRRRNQALLYRETLKAGEISFTSERRRSFRSEVVSAAVAATKVNPIFMSCRKPIPENVRYVC